MHQRKLKILMTFLSLLEIRYLIQTTCKLAYENLNYHPWADLKDLLQKIPFTFEKGNIIRHNIFRIG